MKKAIKEKVKKKVLAEYKSDSEWAAPTFGVPKKNGCCRSDESLPNVLTLFRMRFRFFGFRIVYDVVVVVDDNREVTIIFHLERDAVLVVVNFLIEGWRSLRSD